MDFLVIDLRDLALADEIRASVMATLRSRGLVADKAEMKYYGLQSLAEDITRVEYWYKESDEDGN